MTRYQDLGVNLEAASEGQRTPKDFRRTLSTWGEIETWLGTVGYESSLERGFALMMAIDPQVRTIMHQPWLLRYRTRSGRRLRRYTPDYFVERDLSRPWVWGFPKGGFTARELIEIKPHDRSIKTYVATRERYAAARLWCETNSCQFRLISQHFITNAAVENASAVLFASKLTLPAWLISQPVLKAPTTMAEVLDACVTGGDERVAPTLAHIGFARGWFWFNMSFAIQPETQVFPFSERGLETDTFFTNS
jgi:hypothetical protein